MIGVSPQCRMDGSEDVDEGSEGVEKGMGALGDYLRVYRGRMSLRKLEANTGIDRSTWNRLERGHIPDIGTVILLHQRLKIPYEELMTYCEEDVMTGKEETGKDRIP